MPPFWHRQRSGIELTMVIVIMGLVTAIGLALLQMLGTQNILSNREIRQQQIFQIAEAGANYYRWHLAHYPSDYKDGTNAPGPYVHDFKDTTGKVIGKFELTITPPVTGSTIATIKSSGYLINKPSARRVVTVTLGIPSLSKYAVVANADMRFGAGTETFGPIHSNGGVHYDGVAHGPVTSAKTTYTDPDGYGTRNGVWSLNPDATTFLGGKKFPVSSVDFNGITVDLAALKTLAGSPSGLLLPTSGTQGYHLTFRTDDKVDIRRVVTQLRCQYRSGTGSCTIGQCTLGTCSLGQCASKSCSNNPTKACTKNSQCPNGSCVTNNCADNGGCPTGVACQINTCTSGSNCPSGATCGIPTCTANSQCPGSPGSCSFNNSCTTDANCPSGGSCANLKDFGFCSNDFNTPCSQDSTCGGGNTCVLSSFSIGTRATDQTDYQLGVPLPANGIIFVPEDTWVDGTINSARITVVAAADPLASGLANIYINDNLKYTNTDGQDVIGLIAQNNILTGFFSKNDITIDAAMIAQKGRIGRPFYGSSFIGTGNASDFQLYPAGSTLPNGGAGETSCRDFRKRTTLTSLGSLATNQRYGFAWTGTNLFNCGGGLYNNSGYCDRNLTFDANLVYAPPPSFPSSGEFSLISYSEQ